MRGGNSSRLLAAHLERQPRHGQGHDEFFKWRAQSRAAAVPQSEGGAISTKKLKLWVKATRASAQFSISSLKFMLLHPAAVRFHVSLVLQCTPSVKYSTDCIVRYISWIRHLREPS